MAEKTILLKDFADAQDTINGKAGLNKNIRDNILGRLSAGVKKTKITIMDGDTGEVHGVYENKIVLPGSMINACHAFGVSPSLLIPSYNEEMKLDHTDDYDNVPAMNSPIVCMFCIDDSGCGTSSTDVYVADFVDRISPDTIMPFRYQDADEDLSEELRQMYFGRKTLDNGKIAYYFKKFETEPMLHMQYADTTEITDSIWDTQTSQAAEVYIETRLKISRLDFRDYFEQVLGWDKARVSCLSLVTAWYDDTIDDYKYYQNILPYSKLNFSYENLTDLTKSIAFNYQVYY